MKLEISQRRAGVFVPSFALRTETDLGVGDTAGVRQAVDWCAQMKFSVLQLLPINETSDDNSPYNTISSLALEPTTLEVSPATVPGLTATDFKKFAPAGLVKKLRTGPVQYKAVKKLKRDLLECAFRKFSASKTKALSAEQAKFEHFLEAEKDWLTDYSLFRTLLDQHGHPNWEIWPREHKTPDQTRKWLKNLPPAKRAAFEKKTRFFSFVQWLLDAQWSVLRAEAESKGVYLMGDMPFGVSRHSADVWAYPQGFDLKWSGGSPPETWFKGDPFTEKWGQNWGIPVYDWETMEQDDFRWWKRRVQGVTRYFHLFRIDHVLGFYRIYAFPWQPKDNHLYVDATPKQVKAKAGDIPQFLPNDDEDEEGAKANQEHGEKLLNMVLSAAGDATVIAEDLGMVPDYVRPSLSRMGISGFKIPIFEREEGHQEYKNPDHYPILSLATLSTHDHETMRGFWENWWHTIEEAQRRKQEGKLSKKLEQEAELATWEIYRTQRFGWLGDQAMIRDYEPQVREALCRRLFKSASWLAIVQITDVFSLTTRFNVPGPVAESNWSERLPFTVTEMQSSPELEPIRNFTVGAMHEADRVKR